jgi:hypothetical protein
VHLGARRVPGALASWNVSSGCGARLRRSLKGPAIASIAVALALAWTDPARADVCPPAGEAWLRVAFAGDGFTPALRARVLEQLGAEFHAHSLALCDASDASATPAPLADIALALSPESVLSLEVRDAVTGKQITRELPLGGVPRDALALSITLAAEELVHASWIEAALAPPPVPAAPTGLQPVPAPVLEVNAVEVARMPQAERAQHSWMAQAAVLGAAEGSSGGQTDLGGDVSFAIGGRLAMAARAGLRVAPDVKSVHGSVRGRELLAGLGVAYAVVPRDAPFGGDVGIRADLIDVQFSGIPASGAPGAAAITVREGAALGAVMSGTLGGWARLGGPWRIVADAAVGAPIHSVTASDAHETATGVSGVTLGLALGVGVTLPN